MPCRVDSFCTILRNEKVDDYIACSGIETLVLSQDGTVIASCQNDVLWEGRGSPYPTPPGGPWETDYIPNHPKFGRCFYVHSTREADIFIHMAKRKSYGCFIVNPGNAHFLELCIDYRDGLVAEQADVKDMRADAEKAALPIDYDRMEFIR